MSELLPQNPDQNTLTSGGDPELFEMIRRANEVGIEPDASEVARMKQDKKQEMPKQDCGQCAFNETCSHTNEDHKKFTEHENKDDEPNSPLLKEPGHDGIMLEGKGNEADQESSEDGDDEIEFSLNRVVHGKLVYENGKYDFENSKGDRLLGNWIEGAGDRKVYEEAFLELIRSGYAEISIFDHEGNDVGVEWFTYDPKTEGVDNGYSLDEKEDQSEEDEEENDTDDLQKDKNELTPIEPDPNQEPIKKDNEVDLQQLQSETDARQEEGDNEEEQEKNKDEQSILAEILPTPEPLPEPVLESEIPEPVEETEDYSYIEPEITQLEIPVVLRPELTPIVLTPHEPIKVSWEPVTETMITPTAAIEEAAPAATQMVETEIETPEAIDQAQESELKAEAREQVLLGTSLSQEQFNENSLATESTADEESTAQQQRMQTLEYLSPEIYTLDESGISLADDEPTPEPPTLGTAPENNVVRPETAELNTDLDDPDAIEMDYEKVGVTEEPSVLEVFPEVDPDEPAFEKPALEISQELAQDNELTPPVMTIETPPVQEIEEEIVVIPDNTWDILLSSLPTVPETVSMIKDQRRSEVNTEPVEQPDIKNISRVVEALSLFRSSQAPADTSDTADEVSTSNPSAGAAKVIERKAA